MAQLGRITGPLLNANLHREGVDLKISNTTFDSTPVLFFDVENASIGIKTDTPYSDFALDVRTDVLTTNLQVDDNAKIGNVLIKAPDTFSTVVGPLNITPSPVSQDTYSMGYVNSADFRFINQDEFGCRFRDTGGTYRDHYTVNSTTELQEFKFKQPQDLEDAITTAGDTVYISNATTGAPIFGFRINEDSSSGSSNGIFWWQTGYIWIEAYPYTDSRSKRNSSVIYPPSIASMPNSTSAEQSAIQIACAQHIVANLTPGDSTIWTKGPYITDPTPSITLQRMRSDDLEFNDNTISGISSNHSIDIRSATGTVDIPSSGNIYGDLGVTGNFTMDGNLTKLGDLILGDELYNPDVGGGQGDTVEIIPDFSQSLIPGDDDTWSLGSGTLVDSSVRRWDRAYITDNLVNTNNPLPLEVRVSDQQKLDGVNNEIFALQSNDDIILAPDTGINIIEWTQWNEITATSTAASISGFTLTVGGTITGTFVPGMLLTGVGIIDGTIITGTSTGSDSAGTYTVNFNYDGAGSRPSPTGTISISGATDAITNLTDLGTGGPREYPESPLTFAGTGIGYLRFLDSNGVLIPAAGDADRPVRPELGDTRWNTDSNTLEVFAGTIEVVTGIGVVTGLPNQTATNLTGATDGNGIDAKFSISISSGAISNITITNAGQGYTTGDLITILGSSFTGGSAPANNVILTVGAQTDDGYQLSTGGGAEVDVDLMEDLGNEYSLILG